LPEPVIIPRPAFGDYSTGKTKVSDFKKGQSVKGTTPFRKDVVRSGKVAAVATHGNGRYVTVRESNGEHFSTRPSLLKPA
jgi:hypothetical protein